MGKERPEQGGAKQAQRKVKGKKKGGGEGEYRALGGVGETPERRVGQRGPSRGGGIQTPSGGGGGGTVGGGRQAAPETTKLYIDPRLFPGGSAERSWSLAWPRLTSPRGPGQGRPPTAPPPSNASRPPSPRRGHAARRPRPPSSPRHPAAPPPRCSGTLAADPRDPVPDPLRSPWGEEARRTRRQQPKGGRTRRGRRRRRARRSPSFPPFLLAQTQLGWTGPLALCLLLLLHGAMRLGGGSREKRARGRAGRAARTGRGEEGRRAGGGGSGGAAVAAGKNC